MGEVCFRADTDMGLKFTLKDTVPAGAAVLVDSVSDAIELFFFFICYTFIAHIE